MTTAPYWCLMEEERGFESCLHINPLLLATCSLAPGPPGGAAAMDGGGKHPPAVLAAG